MILPACVISRALAAAASWMLTCSLAPFNKITLLSCIAAVIDRVGLGRPVDREPCP